MPSIQAHLLKLVFRLLRFTSSRNTPFDPAKLRAQHDLAPRLFKALVELETEPVDVDSIPGEWITPLKVADGRTILYLHGGYFLAGSIVSHRNLAGNIAAAAQARALIIDYRLAPEHPFPAGLEDAYSAYCWLLAQGIRPGQILLAGDSAGGGLVLSLLLVLRQRGASLPAAAVCLSPVTDMTHGGASRRSNADKELMVDPRISAQVPALYLAGEDPQNPLVSPLFGDLHGLPPLLIQVGSDETLLSDATRFAERARQAGVDVTLEVWPGMQHVWQLMASLLPEGRQAIARIGAFVTQHEIGGRGRLHPGATMDASA